MTLLGPLGGVGLSQGLVVLEARIFPFRILCCLALGGVLVVVARLWLLVVCQVPAHLLTVAKDSKLKYCAEGL